MEPFSASEPVYGWVAAVIINEAVKCLVKTSQYVNINGVDKNRSRKKRKQKHYVSWMA